MIRYYILLVLLILLTYDCKGVPVDCDPQILFCLNNKVNDCTISFCSSVVMSPIELSYNQLFMLNVTLQIDTQPINITAATFRMTNVLIVKAELDFHNEGIPIYIEVVQAILITTELKNVPYLMISASQDLNISQSHFSLGYFGLYSRGYMVIQDSQIQILKVQCERKCSCYNPPTCNPDTVKMQFISILKYSVIDFELDKLLSELKLINEPELLRFLIFKQYTSVWLSRGQINITNSLIVGSSLGFYCDSMLLDPTSKISSDGLGCDAQVGLGCGFNDWVVGSTLQCGSSGASHGGIGGFGGSQQTEYFLACMQLTPRDIYDNPFQPVYEGSGGGGEFGGRGGGVIFIEVLNNLRLDGFISSNGVPPNYHSIQDPTVPLSDSGGGSGGSVQVHVKDLQGFGYITADGGGAESKNNTGNGGSGGGGRILLNSTQWFNRTFMPIKNYVTISASSGHFYKNNIDMLNKYNKVFSSIVYQGSIITSPCHQGYYKDDFTNCQQCPAGYYKAIIDLHACTKCANIGDRYLFDQSVLQTNPSCLITGCKPPYQYEEGECYTAFEQVINKIGGPNGLFAIYVSLTLLIISAIIIVFKKIQHKSRRYKKTNQAIIQEFDPSNLIIKRDESSAKSEFILEDLPYHVGRFYLHGENTPSSSWKFMPETTFIEDDIRIEYIKINEFIANINMKASYSCSLRWILKILRYFYYPFYYFFLLYCKNNAYAKLTKWIVKNKIETFKTNETGFFIKFTATPDQCLSYVDILNYNKDALQWNNQTSFPVSLILSGLGSFLYPLQVYQRDPLVRSLNLCFQNKRLFQQQFGDDDDEDSGKELESDITSFDHFLQRFNQLALMIDFRQTLCSFLTCFLQLIRFIELQNEEVFQSNGIKIDLCVHLLANEEKYAQLQSSIVMLSFRDQRELKKTLKEIHLLKNFSDQYEIKFSINFDQLIKNSKHHYYDDHVVVTTEKDLNQQINEYRNYEDDKEELKLLKQKMIRRMENLQRPLLDGRDAFYSENNQHDVSLLSFLEKQVHQITCTSQMSRMFQSLARIQSLCFSYYLRFRFTQLNSKLLTGILLILLIVQFTISIGYPIILTVQFQDQSMPNNILWFEFAFGVFFFPLSWFFSPILMTIWFICSYTTVGKKFLVMNYVAILNSGVVLFLGVIQIIIGFSEQPSNPSATIMNFIKIANFLNLNALGYFGCLYLNNNDDIEHLNIK